MSRAASVVAVFATGLSAFVTASAAVNGFADGSAAPPAFYILGAGLVVLGVFGVVLAFKGHAAGPLALLIPAAVGFIALPYLVPGAVFFLAGLFALTKHWPKGGLAMRALLAAAWIGLLASGALLLLGSFAYPIAALIAVVCAFGSAVALVVGARPGALS